MRMLLDRLEDARPGAILPEWLHADDPAGARRRGRATAEVLGDEICDKFPFAGHEADAPTIRSSSC